MKIRSLALASLFVVAHAHAHLVREKFNADPAFNGWQSFGVTNLFQWNATNQVLNVTWDSTQPNSYFYHPLGATLTTNDSFCVQFDLQLADAAITSGYQTELAVGLINFSEATNANYTRTLGTLPDVFEFDYFPADSFGDPASLDGTLSDSGANFYFAYDNQELLPGMSYHVVLIHQANSAAISSVIYTNGQVMSVLPNVYANYPTTNDFGAFQVDTLSISSYMDDGYGDDILAHGTVANISCAWPLPVGAVSTPAAGRVQFTSDTNWLYTLEKSTNFQTWLSAAPATFGNGRNLILSDTNTPANQTYYRVRADLP